MKRDSDIGSAMPSQDQHDDVGSPKCDSLTWNPILLRGNITCSAGYSSTRKTKITGNGPIAHIKIVHCPEVLDLALKMEQLVAIHGVKNVQHWTWYATVDKNDRNAYLHA